MSEYNNNLDKIITTYKPSIKFLNQRDYKDINDFNEAIKNLIKSIKGYNTLLVQEGGNKFLTLSYLTFLLPFKEYKPYNNGNLFSNSLSCLFTLADVVEEGDNNYRLFIKLSSKIRQRYRADDSIIIDILSAIIFEYILNKDKYINNRSNIVSYKGSTLSYVSNVNETNKWDFNIISDRTNGLTYYDENNLTKMTPPPYKDEYFLVMYEAINDPINVTDIFIQDNRLLMIEVFNNCCNIYDFIKDIGFDLGFMHNDLHMGNIVYDKLTKKLILIDFGRSSFAYFIHNYTEELSNEIFVEFTKLDYSYASTGNASSMFSRQNYKYKQENNIKELYEDNAIYGQNIAVKTANDKYFGGIFDLITFSLNMYIRTLYYIHKYKNSELSTFKNHFDSIIKINYDVNNPINLVNHEFINFENEQGSIDEQDYEGSNEEQIPKFIDTEQDLDTLINSFVNIRDNYINTLICEKTKRHFTMLLEGLLYTALLIHFNKFNTNLIFKYFQVVLNNDLAKFMKDFHSYLIDIINKYRSQLSSDSFLMKFQVIRGGLTNRFKNTGIISPTKKSVSNSFSLFTTTSIKTTSVRNRNVDLQRTAEAYKRLYQHNYSYPIKGSKKGGFKSKKILKKY
jgi:hypothetical protein